MGTMLYNGVELPNIDLADVDRSVYPYCYIYNSTPTYYMLYFCNEPFYAKTSSSISCNNDFTLLRFDVNGELWKYYTTFNFKSGYGVDMVPVWTNTDICYSDGSIFVSASDPVDPNAPTVDTARRLKSLINGLLCGLVSPGQLKAREATMYSYNGVVLPKLPEWDRESYPYAYISHTDTSKVYNLVVSDTEPNWESYTSSAGNTQKTLQIDGDANWCIYRYHVEDSADWEQKTSSAPYVILASRWLSSDSYTTALIWTNTNTNDYYGTLLLAASEPVPVYE